jgi:hypothetical protein
MRRHKNNIPHMTRSILKRKRKLTVKIYRRMYEIAQSVVERARFNAVTSRVLMNTLHSRAFLKCLRHFGGATEPA